MLPPIVGAAEGKPIIVALPPMAGIVALAPTIGMTFMFILPPRTFTDAELADASVGTTPFLAWSFKCSTEGVGTEYADATPGIITAEGVPPKLVAANFSHSILWVGQ
jgi:hypothetical protein